MEEKKLSLSLVLPGYNEEASIKETVETGRNVLGSLLERYEIIIVNDGSTDKTAIIADRLQEQYPEVTVVHNPINLGVGISLQIGFQAANCDLVLHNAMDYPFDLKDLELLLPLFPTWDVVIVSRTDRSAHSLYRKITSLVHFWLVRLLFRVPFSDMNFVQVYKRNVLQHLSVKAKSPAFVTPELLIRAKNQGFRITEFKAPFHPRKKGQANYGKPRDILWTLADMLSYWIENSWGKKQS